MKKRLPALPIILKKFWERRMREQIIAYVAHDGKGLHELALEAVKRLQ